MKELPINIKIPADVWALVSKIVAKRTTEGKGVPTKKAVVADAIKYYYESQK